MRDILFRGKEELTEYQINMGYKESKWVYGYYWTNEVGNHFIRVTRDEKQFYLFNDYEVMPETVGQFTGLPDKNGTKIFEGDLFSIEHGYNWSKTDNFEVVFSRSYGWILRNKDGVWFPLRDKIKYKEVIGNIHERENDERNNN